MLVTMPILIIRNEWVFKKRREFADIFYAYKNAYYGIPDVVGPEQREGIYIKWYGPESLEDILWDYHKMMRHWWIWDISKMTVNKIRYKEMCKWYAECFQN